MKTVQSNSSKNNNVVIQNNSYTYLYHSVNEHISLHFETVWRVHVYISVAAQLLSNIKIYTQQIILSFLYTV